MCAQDSLFNVRLNHMKTDKAFMCAHLFFLPFVFFTFNTSDFHVRSLYVLFLQIKARYTLSFSVPEKQSISSFCFRSSWVT